MFSILFLLLCENVQERAVLTVKSGQELELRKRDEEIKRHQEKVAEWEEKVKQRQQLLLEKEQEEGE